MKTHSDIVRLLRTKEEILRTEFGISEMGIVSPKVEYAPVSSVCLFVVGEESSGFERLKNHLSAELELTVEVIARANANGAFRYVFALPRT